MIPTADDEVLRISENRQKLEEFFLFVLADHWILQSCVEKRHFYPLVEKLGFPSPLTFFPESLQEVETLSRELEFPFLVKPSRSLAFQEKFHRKSFVIKSKEDLDRVIRALEDTGLHVLLQEIIPGNQFHEVYFYFNPRGELVAQCGWDRIRQFPPGFGNGTFCRNTFRSEPAELGEAFLTKVGFCGLAAVEFVCDPRNHQFKLIEVNPRTTLQNRLPAACGVDLEWLAYLDLIGKEVKPVPPPDTGNLWVDDFTDLLPRMARRVPDNSESPHSPRRKVRSIACWDDPLPLLARMVFLLLNTVRLVHSRITTRISRLISRCTI
jgi:predicted ATP-grasp superfamily ATP-dependent carboligase